MKKVCSFLNLYPIKATNVKLDSGKSINANWVKLKHLPPIIAM